MKCGAHWPIVAPPGAHRGPALAPLSVNARAGTRNIDLENRACRMVAATGDRARRASIGEIGRRVDGDENHRAS
jgi:hypothetical protein